MVTHSSILYWRIPWTEEPGGYSPQGHKESDTRVPVDARGFSSLLVYPPSPLPVVFGFP